MAVSVRTANRLRTDGNPTAVELHSDCIETAPTIQKSAALSTVAGRAALLSHAGSTRWETPLRNGSRNRKGLDMNTKWLMPC